MKDNFGFVVFLIVTGIFFGAFVGSTATEQQGNVEMKQKAVEHNCAEHDAKTGEWGWK